MLSGILFIITQLMTQNKNNQCKKIRAKKQHLNVPSEVDGLPTTSIRKNFYRGNSLTSVNIPDSVTTIEDGAFSGFTNLTSLQFPKKILISHLLMMVF
jgi:hypothetical protein